MLSCTLHPRTERRQAGLPPRDREVAVSPGTRLRAGWGLFKVKTTSGAGGRHLGEGSAPSTRAPRSASLAPGRGGFSPQIAASAVMLPLTGHAETHPGRTCLVRFRGPPGQSRDWGTGTHHAFHPSKDGLFFLLLSAQPESR